MTSGWLHRDRRRASTLGFCIGAAVTAVAMSVRPAVRLSRVAVPVDESAATVRQRLLDRLDHAEVLARGDGVVVAEFRGQAGPFRYHTVEEVRTTPEGVTFTHLRGPLPRVEETIVVRPTGPVSAELVHTGTIGLRGGLLGWLFGLIVVRPAFDGHVRTHLAQIAR